MTYRPLNGVMDLVRYANSMEQIAISSKSDFFMVVVFLFLVSPFIHYEELRIHRSEH